MLEHVSGVVLAVRDRKVAVDTFAALFGAEEAAEHRDDVDLQADITSLACGTDYIHLAEPTGDGPVATHLESWGEGLLAAVFSTSDLDGLAKRLAERGVEHVQDSDSIHVPTRATHGLHTIVMATEKSEPVGAISFLYEVTHLVHDWRSVSDFWTDAFGLEDSRFSPISSDTFGYEGMLTLFDPPDRLDRVEVITPNDPNKAMGKFFAKRGEGPYMFFTECADTPALRERLDAAGARYAPAEDVGGPNSLFLHPSSTHGVLIGVSPTNHAWTWSGRPELAKSD